MSRTKAPTDAEVRSVERRLQRERAERQELADDLLRAAAQLSTAALYVVQVENTKACERLMDVVTHSRRAWRMLGGGRALEQAIADAGKRKARRTRARGRRAGA